MELCVFVIYEFCYQDGEHNKILSVACNLHNPDERHISWRWSFIAQNMKIQKLISQLPYL
jgi:hypothetical protein